MTRRRFCTLAGGFAFVRTGSGQANEDFGLADAVSKYDLPHLCTQDFANLSSSRPVWSKSCQKTNSSPAISGDKVILLEREDRERERVRCFRLRTGQTLWEYRYAAPLPRFFDGEFGWGPHSTPSIQDRIAITIGLTGIAWAIDIETGKPLWRRDLWAEFSATPLERGFAATPALESTRLIVPVGGNDSGLVALDPKTGNTLWAKNNLQASYASPVLGTFEGQRQVVALMSDVLAGIDPASGELLWQTPFQTPNSVHVASPLIIGQRFVVAGSSGGTRLLRVEKKQRGWAVDELWRTTRCAPQIGNFIRVKDQVFAPASGGTAEFTVCLNLRDGSMVWKERFGGRGSVFRLQDGILTLNDSGDLEVRSCNSTSSARVFRFANFAASPQWNAPAFNRDVMVLQSGKTLQAWRLGSSDAGS